MTKSSVENLILSIEQSIMHTKIKSGKSTTTTVDEKQVNSNLDDLISQISGVFQTRIYIILVLLVAPLFAFNNVTQFLILLEPEHRCRALSGAQANSTTSTTTVCPLSEQRSVFAFKANLQKSCELIENENTLNCIDGHEYNYSFIYPTLVSENDWVCGESWKTYFVHTIYWTGSLFGVIVIGFVSDRYGRIVAIMLCHTIAAVCGVLTVYAVRNFALLLFLRAMMGFVVLSQGAVSFLYVIEFTDTKRRNSVSNVYLISFAVTFAVSPFIAYYLRNWVLLSIATSAPMIAIPVIFAFLPESVRWLKTRSAEQMKRTLKRVAAINGKELSEAALKCIEVTKEDEQPLSCILHNRRLFFIFLNTNIIWFLQNLAYTGSNTYASNSSDNPFLNLSVCSILDIIAAFVSNYTADAFGRKMSTIASAVIAGIAYSVTVLIPGNELTSIIGLTFTGRLLLTIGHNVHYLYAVEVYPTVIRGRALSVRMALGSLGNLLSPQIMLLSVYSHQLPLLILGLCCFLYALIMFSLPETVNKPLPQTVDDIELFYSRPNAGHS